MGKVDLNKVGTMGHSRGGEGVVRHFLLNQEQGSPFGVGGVFPLAPTDFSRFVINNVPLAVMTGYCDGDVVDLQGVHFYDDARTTCPGIRRRSTRSRTSANHNFYNTVWTPGLFPAGAADDWVFVRGGESDPQCAVVEEGKRLTDAQQRAVARAYLSGFFLIYLKGQSQFLPSDNRRAAPPSATTKHFPSYHAPRPAKRRESTGC